MFIILNANNSARRFALNWFMTRRAEYATLSSKSNTAAEAIAGVSRWRVFVEIVTLTSNLIKIPFESQLYTL